MEDKIVLTSTSLSTADMTPIVLSENSDAQVIFEIQQVDNQKNPKQKLSGKFIYAKKDKRNGEIKRLNKRSVQRGESFELNLDCEETYILWTKLNEYYKLVEGKLAPMGTQVYVKQDEDYLKLKTLLQDKSKLTAILQELDLENLNTSINLENLKRIREIIKSNLDNADESFWQETFEKNSWVLSQLFNLPCMIFNGMCYVGGKSLGNAGGKYTDFIYKNPLTKNTALVEIKTPATTLFTNRQYRADVPEMSADIVGAVNQILLQKQKYNHNYYTLNAETNEEFYAININCIIIVGKLEGLDKTKITSFVNYRNELRSVDIITFDELLNKIDFMITLLESDNVEME